MDKRKNANTSVVGSVSKPGPDELVKFLTKWNVRQWPEIWCQIEKGALPLDFPQAVIEHRNPFEILTGYERLLRWHEGWPRFWRAFGFLYDHEALVLPEYREGFGWSIVTPPFGEWSASRLLHEVCGRMFPTLQFYSDEKINKVTSFQELIDTHVVLVRDTVEADECHKGKSVEFIEQNKIPAITLRQREVLEARYYFETGGHLDVVNFTLCCGSRYSGGDVPHAYWRGGKFHVGRVHPADEDGHWRVRELSL